jgi:transposase InsO family protein
MPWKETCVLDEKMAFIAECLREELPMTALCERFGISRDTGYRLLKRYREAGAEGLQPRSRAPHRHGLAMAPEVAEAIVALRRKRRYWGPKKLRAVLQRGDPRRLWPAPSTIGDLLRREGLSAPRRRQRRAVPVSQPFLPVCEPNDLWCIDFKGWFRTADGQRCDPLTITDADSRFLIECRIVPETIAAVQPVVDQAFRELGLPQTIRSDNGPPFASSSAAGGLTRLSVHWVKLGIRLERIDPGSPQQNGRHERMHATLKAETSRPPAATPAEQQARFDRFRNDFNDHRPHEALGQVPPTSRYRPSPRPYPSRVAEPWYDAEHAVRRVRPNGEIKWGGELVFLSQALAGEPVGIAETEPGDWLVRFGDIELGLIDRRTKQLRRFMAGRPARHKAAKPEQTEETVRHVSGL